MKRPVRPVALVILTACALYPGLTSVFQGLYPWVAGQEFAGVEGFDDFIVKGNNSPDHERNGSLVFLDASLQDPLIGVAMQRLGILRVSQERAAQGSDAIARVNVELYCEGMELSPAPA